IDQALEFPLNLFEAIAPGSRIVDLHHGLGPQPQPGTDRQAVDVQAIDGDLLAHFPRSRFESLGRQLLESSRRHQVELPFAALALAVARDPLVGYEYCRGKKRAGIAIFRARRIAGRGVRDTYDG